MISGKMKIGELVRTYPGAVGILRQFGMGCVGCPSSQAETIEEACQVHGLNLELLLAALNKKL